MRLKLLHRFDVVANRGKAYISSQCNVSRTGPKGLDRVQRHVQSFMRLFIIRSLDMEVHIKTS